MKIFILVFLLSSRFAVSAIPFYPEKMFPEGETYLYKKVLESYRQSRLHDLVHSQETLQKYFPKSSLADNALYLRGLLELQKDMLPEALSTFSTIEINYPLSSKRAGALFAKGVLYNKLNIPQAARSAFERLLHSYPGSLESFRAQAELKRLKKIGSS